MTKFIVNNRTDALKTDLNLFFAITDYSTFRSRSLTRGTNFKFMGPYCRYSQRQLIHQTSFQSFDILARWYKTTASRRFGVTAFRIGGSFRDISSPISRRMYVNVPRVTLRLEYHSSSEWGCVHTSLKRGRFKQLKIL